MILAFCGCCLIVSIHFYVLMRLLMRDLNPCLRVKESILPWVCVLGLLGASQIGKALSFDLNYCGFESHASIPL